PVLKHDGARKTVMSSSSELLDAISWPILGVHAFRSSSGPAVDLVLCSLGAVSPRARQAFGKLAFWQAVGGSGLLVELGGLFERCVVEFDKVCAGEFEERVSWGNCGGHGGSFVGAISFAGPFG